MKAREVCHDGAQGIERGSVSALPARCASGRISGALAIRPGPGGSLTTLRCTVSSLRSSRPRLTPRILICSCCGTSSKQCRLTTAAPDFFSADAAKDLVFSESSMRWVRLSPQWRAVIVALSNAPCLLPYFVFYLLSSVFHPLLPQLWSVPSIASSSRYSVLCPCTHTLSNRSSRKASSKTLNETMTVRHSLGLQTWPRTAAAAGSFWNYESSIDGLALTASLSRFNTLLQRCVRPCMSSIYPLPELLTQCAAAVRPRIHCPFGACFLSEILPQSAAAGRLFSALVLCVCWPAVPLLDVVLGQRCATLALLAHNG